MSKRKVPDVDTRQGAFDFDAVLEGEPATDAPAHEQALIARVGIATLQTKKDVRVAREKLIDWYELIRPYSLFQEDWQTDGDLCA